MRLKRLDTTGFKSFADRTIFAFEPGITAILGPNGSGKSNVVDAIKWVLGETRPTSLRGSEMQDVVFKGAEGRAGAGFAEVTLVLDNEDQFLPGLGSEVAIGRRLFRTGESEYLIDRQMVRRKDVRELLLDTGLGVGAYSVMEQGKIDAILSANPEDRRQIFDEASGISRYKLRRKEALRRLERTEQNLLRLGDLLEEKRSRLRSLRIQAGRARRYQHYRERLMTLRVALGVAESRVAREEGRQLARQIHQQEERLAALEEALLLAGRDLAEGRSQEAHLEKERRLLRDRLAETRSAEQGTRERLRGLELRVATLEKRVVEAAGQRERILASRSRQEEEFFAAQEKADALAADLGEQREKLAGVQRLHADWAGKLRRALEERKEAEEESLEGMRRSTRASNSVSECESRLQALGQALERIGRRTDQAEGNLRELGARIQERRQEAETQVRAAGGAREWLGVAQATRDAARARLAELGRVTQQLREDLSGLQSRAQVLRDLELSLAGLEEAPRRVLAADFEGGWGRLVEYLECAPAHARALEAALGDRVQALVVDGPDQAARILAWLRQERLGQVHLVLREGILEWPADEEPFPALPGTIGRLRGLVRVRPGFESLVDTVLRNTLLVADLAAGREVSRLLGPGHVCVTLAGERIERGVLVSGGDRELTTGPIQRRSELRQLEQSLQMARDHLAENQAREDRTRQEEEEARRQESEACQALAEAEGACQEIEADLLRLEERAAAATRERELYRLEGAESRASMDQAEGDLGSARAALATSREEATRSGEHLVLARRAVEEITRHKEEASQEENRLRVQLASGTSELQGLRERLLVLGRSVQENGLRVEELRSDTEESQGGIEEARAEMAALEVEVQGLLADRARLEERIQALDARGDQRHEEVQVLEDRVEAGRDEREELRRLVESLRFQARELAARVGATREKLLEDHDVDLEFFLQERAPFGPPLASGRDGAGRPLFGPPLAPGWTAREERIERIWLAEDFDLAAARSEAADVRSSMDRIGTVNLRAVEELAQEEEGVATLDREERDMSQARKSLQEMIDRINRESTLLFQETFAKARVNFQEIFRKLFQGGKAEIQLTPGMEPLEAGIEIVARPPGKQLQNINLLSGGERSLCALAILFGVFKVKPSPFAVLDEVDAALDDSNVDRFLEVLRGFVSKTQFLVVTHNKRTMAAAAILYGITMRRKGISTCVSVRLDQVDRVAEVAAAGG